MEYSLKIHFLYVHSSQSFSCIKKVIFINEFSILDKIIPFYEERENDFAHGGIPK